MWKSRKSIRSKSQLSLQLLENLDDMVRYDDDDDDDDDDVDISSA
jgi:hypothetical protein